MKKIDGSVNWMKLAHLLSMFPLNFKTPFCASISTYKFSIGILFVVLELYNGSPLCVNYVH